MVTTDPPEADTSSRFFTIFETAAVANGAKAERQYDFTPRSTDVIVVGAPKTGTTWVQQILHQMRTKGDMSFQDIYDVSWWLPYYYMPVEGFDFNADQPAEPRILKSHEDIYDVSWWLPYYYMPVEGFDFNADQPAEPRILKSHEVYDRIPRADGVKYVFICRDPVDTSWSYMKFLGGFLGAGDSVSTELMLMTPNTATAKFSGGVSELIESWYPHRQAENVLWLHYEDLKSNLSYCVDRLSKFVGIPLSGEEKEIVLKHSSFEFMSKHKEKFRGDALAMAKALRIENWKPKAGMIRPEGGEVGQGTRLLPEAIKESVAESWNTHVAKPLGFAEYKDLRAETSLLKDLV